MRGQRRRLIQAMLFLVTLAALPYVPFLHGYFLADDLMLDYFLLEDGALSAEKMRYHFFPVDGYVERQIYRPVDFIQLAVDWSFWGTNPFGYHLSNLMLHAWTTILVFFLIRRLGDPGGQTFPSVFGGALFALHPLAPEAVQWIVGRVDLTSCFFTVAMLLAFVRYRQTGRTRFYVVSLAALVFGLMSKDVVIFAPGYVLLYDVCRPDRWRGADAIRRTLATQAAFVSIVVAYLLFRIACFGQMFGKYESAGQSVFETLAARGGEAFGNVARLVHEVLFPVREGAFGDGEGVAMWLCLAVGYLAIVGVAVTRGLVRGASPSPGATFAGAWCVATLAPMAYLLLLLPVSSDHLNGRLAYLPLAAFCTAFPLFLFGSERWRERSWVRLRFGSACLLPIVFYPLAFVHAQQFFRAGEDVVAIRRQVEERHAARPAGTPVLFANAPTERNGVYVLRTGLPFLFRPPFSSAVVPIVGLNLTTPEEFGRFIDQYDAEPLYLRWSGARHAVRPIDPYPGAALPSWSGPELESFEIRGGTASAQAPGVELRRTADAGGWSLVSPTTRVSPAALANVTVRMAVTGESGAAPVLQLACVDETGSERLVDYPFAGVPADGEVHERRIALRGRVEHLRRRDAGHEWRFTERIARVALRFPASWSTVVVESIRLSRYPAALEVVAPADGASLPTAGPIPPFQFRAAPGVGHYRLVLDIPFVGRRTARFARSAAAGTIVEKALAGGNLAADDFSFDLTALPAEFRGQGITFRWWIEALTDPDRPGRRERVADRRPRASRDRTESTTQLRVRGG